MVVTKACVLWQGATAQDAEQVCAHAHNTEQLLQRHPSDALQVRPGRPEEDEEQTPLLHPQAVVSVRGVDTNSG